MLELVHGKKEHGFVMQQWLMQKNNKKEKKNKQFKR
jgi:hypothetical protein